MIQSVQALTPQPSVQEAAAAVLVVADRAVNLGLGPRFDHGLGPVGKSLAVWSAVPVPKDSTIHHLCQQSSQKQAP